MSTKAADRAKITEKAEHYVKAGKLEEAAAEYQKLLDGSGQDISIGNIIGDLCLQLGQEDRAVQLFLANVETLERRGAYSQALAIAKKVNKIRPSDPTGLIRLGDLYGQLGFSIEARDQYAKAAEELEKRNDIKPLIALYEKRARIDRSDLVTRLKLARLYLEDSKGEQAQVVLNDAADLLYVRKEYGEAEKILLEAVAVGDGDFRTLANLIRVNRELHRPDASLTLLECVIKKRGPRTDILGLMALLYGEQGENDKAAEIYERIFAEEPGNLDIRAKAGMVEIKRGRLDAALDIFDPLVSLFLQKSDEDKAAGLLGLILMSGRMHLPTLERLTGVFRGVGRTKDLEISLRVLLAEYRSVGRENDRIRVLRELYMLSPMDPEIMREAEKLGVKTEFRKSAVDKGNDGGGLTSDEDREMIRLNLAKAELYLEQGLTRNARRILENLRLLYPDDPRIQKKIESLHNAPTLVVDEEIPEIVEQTVRKEIDIIRATLKPAASKAPAPALPSAKAAKPAEPIPPAPVQHLDLESLISDISAPPPAPAGPVAPPPEAKPPVVPPEPPKKKGPVFSVRSGQAAPQPAPAGPAAPPTPPAAAEPPEGPPGSKVTAAEIFAGLDIGPFVPPATAPTVAFPGYIDIADKIEEEIEALEAEFYKQIKERTSVIEKDLVEIVQEFRRQVDIKLDQRNYESRYNLGVAFLEQNLYEEAIAEFELAAADPTRAADCWGLIGQCYVKKRNYPEARRCFEGAISLTPAESPDRFALAYELASLYEMMGENEAALALYREVSGWNPKFRNTAKRIKILEKIVP
ncbi:MAG: tetratricopeptide repeat protein [Candidatus Aminicenantes bacterium]|nr:tetratricopeptide repeat protein [Candidatus Aminicenantes bacterium]